jgi:hypothetical protein
MGQLESKYILAHPARRPLRIFASDPMLARTPGNRLTIEIPNEPLERGPIGSRFKVIDYDGAQHCFYPLPHAFHGANAYYDPELMAILFGYFRADRRDPGPNLPGQTVSKKSSEVSVCSGERRRGIEKDLVVMF